MPRAFYSHPDTSRGALHHLHAQLPLAAVLLLNGRPSGGPVSLLSRLIKYRYAYAFPCSSMAECLGVLVHLNVNVVRKCAAPPSFH